MSSEDLLQGDDSFGATAAEQADGPVEKDGEAVLETRERRQVHDEPHQPGGQTGKPHRADAATAR